MTDAECIEFLQWCLPQMGMRWSGFRKVRKQVRKRINRRMNELGLDDHKSYRAFLESHPEEWPVVGSFCRISISRFYRDKAVFDHLRSTILPELADLARTKHDSKLRCWSIGCASGEEPYTLGLLWQLHLASLFPDIAFEILASDAEDVLLKRAKRGEYSRGSVRDVPPEWMTAFEPIPDGYRLRSEFRHGIRFVQLDIRDEMPDALERQDHSFLIILCRNLVFT